MAKRITKIVLTGGPAAGKTTLVSRVLKEFKVPFISLLASLTVATSRKKKWLKIKQFLFAMNADMNLLNG